MPGAAAINAREARDYQRLAAAVTAERSESEIASGLQTARQMPQP